MEVRRKQNESMASLMRRFSRLVQRTGVLATAKDKRSRKRKPTQRVEKNRAIMGVQLRALRARLQRLGQYDEETFEEEKRKVKQKLDL